MKTAAIKSALSFFHPQPTSRRRPAYGYRSLNYALLAAGVWLAVLPAAWSQDTGTLTTLYNFTGGSDQYSPNGLVQGSDGNFYGTTFGPYDESPNAPNGTVFKMTPAGALTILYRFDGLKTGARCQAKLVQGSDGDFYGTTELGGNMDAGVVYKITPKGAYTRLYSFNRTDGYGPVAALIQGSDGNFYGTTESGGASNAGTVFKITPAGVLTTLHSFDGKSEGGDPLAGLVQGSDGDFYGTTALYVGAATGTVYRISPAGVFTVVYRFTGQDGDFVQAGLVQGSDGNFYGLTYYGGPEYQPSGPAGSGTLYQLTPAGRLTILHAFSDGADGGLPDHSLVQGSDGNFYGATPDGGTTRNGTLFKLTVNPPPAFFDGATALDSGVYYLTFPGGNYFGYYSYLLDAHNIYHYDLGFEYVFDADDGQGGVYLYDYASQDFLYTSPGTPFPYLYDFNLESFLYYFPDPNHAGHYNTNGTRYFFQFSTGQIISR